MLLYQIFLLFILFVVTIADLSLEWNRFKHDYHKYYSSAIEESTRKQIFIENINRMQAYQTSHPDATFSMRINHLTDRRVEVTVYCPR